ncbi:MAG: glycerol-3-phosphate acyltransferase [Defluviitaleaceae bacterium]|nr:glycerol-3-phosphate acyltransferase [Defluviitaleaceae bacterium]
MEFLMESGMFRVAALLIGYILGNVQTSYLFGRMFRGTDIRDHGSGNAGTSNTIRTFGAGVGALVFAVDVLKAVAAFALCMYIFGGVHGLIPGVYAGAGVVLGHNFPAIMGFRGGKGIASTIGVMICVVDWQMALILVVLGLALLFGTKMVSVASLALTLAFPVLLLTFGYAAEVVAVSALLTVLAWVLHRGNIRRILAGDERKLSLGKGG